MQFDQKMSDIMIEQMMPLKRTHTNELLPNWLSANCCCPETQRDDDEKIHIVERFKKLNDNLEKIIEKSYESET